MFKYHRHRAYLSQDRLGYADVTNYSGSHFVFTMVGWELHPWCREPELLEAPVCVRSRSRGHRQIRHWFFRLCLEVTQANSTHISSAKASYRTMPNAKGQRSPLLPCVEKENQHLHHQLSCPDPYPRQHFS